MEQRLDYVKTAPEGAAAFKYFNDYVERWNIRCWNRFAIPFRSTVGGYTPSKKS